MSWHLNGTYVENCNCAVMCPCGASAFALPGDNERCHVLLAFHIDEGEIESVDVAGLGLAVLADAPGKMIEGNWRVGLLVDNAATDQQARLLAGVFSGQMGGPMEGFAPLIGEVLGSESAPFEWAESGNHHRVKIGDFVELETEDFQPEGSDEPIRVTGVIVHPVNSTLAIGHATASKISAFGIDLDGLGNNAHSAPFAWSD
ncbi:MAG: hypothetical protein QOG33_2786 [Gaiellales bacterium]|nr:hypothetical protein [Gaiellales bacterium]